MQSKKIVSLNSLTDRILVEHEDLLYFYVLKDCLKFTLQKKIG